MEMMDRKHEGNTVLKRNRTWDKIVEEDWTESKKEMKEKKY